VIIVVVRALVRAQVPQLDGLVLGRGRDHETVRREDGGTHPVHVAAETGRVVREGADTSVKTLRRSFNI
jgi:hypothetical protein